MSSRKKKKASTKRTRTNAASGFTEFVVPIVPNTGSRSSRRRRNSNAPLEDQPYYHGIYIRIEDVEEILKKPGDFLVRMDEEPGPKAHKEADRKRIPYISLCVDDQPPEKPPSILHIPIEKDRKKYTIVDSGYGPYTYVTDLIDDFKNNKRPICPGDNRTILITPTPRMSWEIRHEDLVIEEIIGTGNFGDIRKGVLRGGAGAEPKMVALKILKESFMDTAMVNWLKEGKMLRSFDHPNIVQLIGVAVQKTPLINVIEIVDDDVFECLNSCAKSNIQVALKEKVECMLIPVGYALEYLQYKNFIHRNVRAKNVLYGLNKIPKLTDFIFARPGPLYKVQNPNQNPSWRWMPPEVFKRDFVDFTTDVWAFGCYAFEVLSDCQITPFAVAKTKEELIRQLEKDITLSMPAGTPEKLSEIFSTLIFVPQEKRAFITEVVKRLESYGEVAPSNNQLKFRESLQRGNKSVYQSVRNVTVKFMALDSPTPAPGQPLAPEDATVLTYGGAKPQEEPGSQFKTVGNVTNKFMARDEVMGDEVPPVQEKKKVISVRKPKPRSTRRREA